MKKILSLVLAALMLAGTTATVSAAEGEVVNLVNYAEIISQNAAAIGGDGVATAPEMAFDGNIATYCNGGPKGGTAVEGGSDYWIGIYLEQPAFLTSVSWAGPDYNKDGAPERLHAIFGQMVEGSNDGENWEYIYKFTDLDYEDYFYADPPVIHFEVELEPKKAYSYYRMWNTCEGVAVWAEVQFHGILVDEEDVLDYIVGDLNADEDIDILDALLLIRHIMMPDLYPLEDYPSDNLDFNVDGVVDIQDARRIFLHIMDPETYPV